MKRIKNGKEKEKTVQFGRKSKEDVITVYVYFYFNLLVCVEYQTISSCLSGIPTITGRLVFIIIKILLRVPPLIIVIITAIIIVMLMLVALLYQKSQS